MHSICPSLQFIQIPSLHGPGVLVVVDGVIHRDLFVPPMYASMACAAARCIPIEGHTPFIPPSSTLLSKATLRRNSFPQMIVDYRLFRVNFLVEKVRADLVF